MYTKINEYDPKSIQNYYFKLFFKHISNSQYIDFDYDTKKDLLIVANAKMNRVKFIILSSFLDKYFH